MKKVLLVLVAVMLFGFVGKAQIGSAVEYPGRQTMILFNSAGDKYVYYDDNNVSWSGVTSVSQFGGGKCPFNAIGATIVYPGRTTLIMFNKAGDKYVYYDDNNVSWSGVTSVSQFGGGKCPFSSIGAVIVYPGRSTLIIFNKTGDKYVYYDDNNVSWSEVINTSEFGGGKCPF